MLHCTKHFCFEPHPIINIFLFNMIYILLHPVLLVSSLKFPGQYTLPHADPIYIYIYIYIYISEREI